MAHIEFLDETMRDGQQSLWGMRMQAGMALPVSPSPHSPTIRLQFSARRSFPALRRKAQSAIPRSQSQRTDATTGPFRDREFHLQSRVNRHSTGSYGQMKPSPTFELVSILYMSSSKEQVLGCPISSSLLMEGSTPQQATATIRPFVYMSIARWWCAFPLDLAPRRCA